MKGHKVLTSSKSDEWATPQDFFDVVNDEFKFKWDIAATAENTKCKKWSDDSLTKNWTKKGWCWCNPPYSKVKEFSKMCCEQSIYGGKFVLLIPARTDTRYWYDYIKYANQIRFIKGRLKFGEGIHAAPFPSALVVFGKCVAIGNEVTFWGWR